MKKERDAGLDTLKAMSIIFVLLWHLKPLTVVVEPNATLPTKIPRLLVEIPSFEVLLTAVPIFVIISLYLFLRKSNKTLRDRLWHIAKLFLFWSCIQCLVYYFATGKHPNFLAIETYVGIAPKLPYAGDSVFYYLFNLFFLTFFAFFYQRLKPLYRKILCPGIIVFYLLYFEVSRLFKFSIPYWSLNNFLIYISIAYLFFEQKEAFLKFKNIYLAIYLLFVVHDVLLQSTGSILNVYGRVSVVFGALTLFCFIYALPSTLPIKNNALVQNIARYSLGLYALHKYGQFIAGALLKDYEIYINIIGAKLDVVAFLIATIATALAGLMIYGLRLTRLKPFIA